MVLSSIAETQTHLGELLHKVLAGETLIILDKKTPIARVERYADAPVPKTYLPLKNWSTEEILSLPIAKATREEADLSRAVIQERASGW
jgi:antitoxin (DNA-binding transcriptional repressor) of toxin-antitoxin stability system